MTLALTAGSSETSSGSVGGSLTLTAGTASPAGQQSSVQILGTNTAGLGGDIILSSTGQITANAALIASQGATVSGPLAAAGNTVLGTSSSQTVVVNAKTTFQSPVVANAALTANGAVTVAGPLSVYDADMAGMLSVHGNIALGKQYTKSKLSCLVLVTQRCAMLCMLLIKLSHMLTFLPSQEFLLHCHTRGCCHAASSPHIVALGSVCNNQALPIQV